MVDIYGRNELWLCNILWIVNCFFVIAMSLEKKIAQFVTRTVFSIKSDRRIQGRYRIIYGVIFVSVLIRVGLITLPYIDGFQLPKWALFQQEVEPFPID